MPPGLDPLFPGLDPLFPGLDPLFPGLDPLFPGLDPLFPGLDPLFPGLDPLFPGGVLPTPAADAPPDAELPTPALLSLIEVRATLLPMRSVNWETTKISATATTPSTTAYSANEAASLRRRISRHSARAPRATERDFTRPGSRRSVRYLPSPARPTCD